MTATAEQRSTHLTDDQLQQVLALIKEADSVELKLTVPEQHHRSTVSGLGMDALDAQIRQVFFFDTPDLALDQAGVVVRARRIQGKGNDSVVKLRPVVPHELPGKVRRAPDFGVEVDAMPGGFVCSGSFKNEWSTDTVRDAIAGNRPLRKLFSKEQRAFYATHAPEGIELDKLTVLGPITVLKLKFSPEGFDRRLVAELWFYPDGSRILELSTKCMPSEAFDVAATARSFLTSRGVDLSAEQKTKTRTALEFFADQAKQGAEEPATVG